MKGNGRKSRSMPQDDNWRPKLSRIDDPIADDCWEYVTPKGQRRISRLTVGRPVHYPEQRLWYCPVLIEGHTQPRIKPVFGLAIELALGEVVGRS